MALFQKATPTKKLESAVADLRARAERLASKRADAQAAFDASLTAREAFFVSGDLDDNVTAAKLQGRCDAARTALTSLDAAITSLAAQQAAAEDALAEEQNRIAREAAADALAAQVAVIEAMIEPWLQQSRTLAAELQKLTVRFDLPQIGLFIADAAGQVETALGVALEDARGAVDRIRSGAEAIPRVETEPAPVVDVLPPETRRLFLLRACKWTGADGTVQIGARFRDADLPPHVAVRALKIGAAVSLDHALRKQHHGTWPGHPNAASCELLDDADASSVAGNVMRDPVLSQHATEFTPLDRGGPRRISVPREVT